MQRCVASGEICLWVQCAQVSAGAMFAAPSCGCTSNIGFLARMRDEYGKKFANARARVCVCVCVCVCVPRRV